MDKTGGRCRRARRRGGRSKNTSVKAAAVRPVNANCPARGWPRAGQFCCFRRLIGSFQARLKIPLAGRRRGQRSGFPPCVNAASPQFAGRLSFCPRADVSRSRPPAGQQQSPARAALWAVFCSRSYSAGGRKPVCAFFLTVPSVVPAGTHRSPGGFIGCALHTHPAKRCPAISRRARCPGGRTVFVL